MKINVISFFSILVFMGLIDALWLGFMVKRFYVPHIGHLFGDTIRIAPAIFFYVLFAFALNVFVVIPALHGENGYLNVFLLGVLFGLAAYGTYDLTSQATLKNWPWILTVVDMAWGGFLTGTVSVITVYLCRTYYFV